MLTRILVWNVHSRKKNTTRWVGCLCSQGGFQWNTIEGCVELLSGPPISECRKTERVGGLMVQTVSQGGAEKGQNTVRGTKLVKMQSSGDPGTNPQLKAPMHQRRTKEEARPWETAMSVQNTHCSLYTVKTKSWNPQWGSDCLEKVLCIFPSFLFQWANFQNG